MAARRKEGHNYFPKMLWNLHFLWFAFQGCIDLSDQFLPITTTNIENIGTVDDTDPRIRPEADIKLKIITVHRDVNRLLNAPATGPEGLKN